MQQHDFFVGFWSSKPAVIRACSNLSDTGCSKKICQESGAHKTHFLDTFTWCLGGIGTCLFIDFLFLIVYDFRSLVGKAYYTYIVWSHEKKDSRFVLFYYFKMLQFSCFILFITILTVLIVTIFKADRYLNNFQEHLFGILRMRKYQTSLQNFFPTWNRGC